jgi:GT2 family glycosyltransferase
MPSFTSLIVTYNSSNEIPDLLADLRRHARPNNVVVIDNNSQDGTPNQIERDFPEVRLVRNLDNVGYARAVNQGFEHCETEYVMLLNPDIRIPNPDLFEELLSHSRRFPELAAVAPLQYKRYDRKRHLNLNWSFLAPKAFRIYLAHLIRMENRYRRPVSVTFLNAGCLFIRRSAFMQAGRLDEKYFLYGGEPDLFLKFKRLGFESQLLPNVEVIHFRERSLDTLTTDRRLRYKLQGAYDTIEALVIGWTRIMRDRLEQLGT